MYDIVILADSLSSGSFDSMAIKKIEFESLQQVQIAYDPMFGILNSQDDQWHIKVAIRTMI